MRIDVSSICTKEPRVQGCGNQPIGTAYKLPPPNAVDSAGLGRSRRFRLQVGEVYLPISKYIANNFLNPASDVQIVHHLRRALSCNHALAPSNVHVCLISAEAYIGRSNIDVSIDEWRL